MYIDLHNSPENQARQKAMLYTVLVAAALIPLLFLARLTFAPASQTTLTPAIDSLQLAYIPLELARKAQTRVAVSSRSAGRAAAPVARWTPAPREARPSAALLPGNTKPNVTTNAPSPVEEPKVDERGLYRKVDKPGNGTSPKATNQEGGSPKGDPSGSIAGPGGTGGIGLDLTGFRFGRLSVAQDPYDETGRIVFVVKVDAQGRILSLNVKTTSVSPAVVAWYRDQLQNARLIPTSSGERPEVSTGQISLKITAH
ncbi:hypothetical protein GCM10023189_10500 [Nibrella saemangeumensis]|uniref:Protein TonB, links inner and outer membranes n=1 Tax=Nibrella saemangeumensis TaxID=1084526 RepID=A0ABP8MIM8_9BACT